MPDKNTGPMRGRPRAFDEQAVIHQAQRVFLEQGFEAVSYEHLAERVGLSKPSLYNAFGDKSALFDRVLKDYADRALTMGTAKFGGQTSLHDGAEAVLMAAADLYAQPGHPSRGCLLVGTALPACSASNNVQQVLSGFLAALEEKLERIISTEYSACARKSGRSPQSLAMQLSTLIISLAVRARAGVSNKELRATARRLLEQLPV